MTAAYPSGRRLLAALVLQAASPAVVRGLDNGLGQLPPMGYNTWNDVGCAGNTADHVRRIADAFSHFGLDRIGYEYVNLDDCWASHRDHSTKRLIPDQQAFPDGIKPLADYVHAKGLKFGIYTDRGDLTCTSRPGSGGYEVIDAQTFADWGVDYLKEDSCYADTHPDKAIEQYRVMRDALNATGRPIFFSLCGWQAWYAPLGVHLGNAWRVARDVKDWKSLWNVVAINSRLAKFSQPGGFNDPDMLLGNGTFKLTPNQTRTQFSLWSVMAAPLIIGSNIPELEPYDLETYSNREVIAVDQDPLGIQGDIIWEDCPPSRAYTEYEPVPDCRQVWSRKLTNDDVAVLVINWGQSYEWKWVTLGPDLMRNLGFSAGAEIRDLWAHTDLGLHHTFQSCAFGGGSSNMYRFSRPTHIV